MSDGKKAWADEMDAANRAKALSAWKRKNPEVQLGRVERIRDLLRQADVANMRMTRAERGCFDDIDGILYALLKEGE